MLETCSNKQRTVKNNRSALSEGRAEVCCICRIRRKATKILANMNSYFEQTGFYGHPHQAAGMMTTTGTHHDQTTAAAAAAYRGFPLSLGMSPYTNHHLHQSRTSQDSPYDASLQAACKQIYEGSYSTKDCGKTGGGNGTTDTTNGYKDVWNSTNTSATNSNTNTATGGNVPAQQNSSVPVRPSACTPDSRVGGYIDASGGSPVSRTGSTAATGVAGTWNTNQCTLTGSAGGQTAPTTGLHQSNHTFYPWMAIAGESVKTDPHGCQSKSPPLVC